MSNTAAFNGSRPAGPWHMVWIATDACNARCLHCSSNSTCQSPDELRTDDALRMIDQLADAGVVDLAVSGGEPLLRKDLFDVIAYARSRGISVGVGSNGGKFTSEQAASLVRAGINRFQVSLDGLGVTHDRLRNWPGLFDRALNSIRIATAAGLRIHVCATINRLNIDELEDLTAFVATQGVKRLNLSRYVPTGRGTDALDLTPEEWRAVVHRCTELRKFYRDRLEIVSHLAQQILVDDCVQRMDGFVGCQAGLGQGCVTANGTVLPCVLLPISVGNIRDQSFINLWQTSPILNTLRDRSNLAGKCGSCAVRSRCGGCRAVAFAKTRDYLAVDPRCWLKPAQDCLIEPA